MKTSEIYTIYKQHPEICTDTRAIKKNSIFFALKGPRFNGNKFAHQAIDAGCKYAIIDEKKYQSEKCILVKDVLLALQELAKLHRKKLNIPIVGITGSNGKTTNKELIYNVLSSQYTCYATKGNLNNQIGVPLSILEINKDVEIAVIEMGADRLGEIKTLCEIASPTHGIITNIGKAHLEGFKSYENIIKTKSELYNFIEKKEGMIFVNNEDTLLMKLSKRIIKKTYGKNKESNTKATIRNAYPFVNIQYDDTIIKSNLIGEFQLYNIAASICIGKHFDVSDLKIKKAIENYIPKNNRSEVIKTKRNHLILDAYNANPSSTELMITSFSKMNTQKKVCILGDMLELGKDTKAEHQNIISLCNKYKIESIFIGKEFNSIIKRNSFQDINEFINSNLIRTLKNSTILLKGSRSIQLENLVEYL